MFIADFISLVYISGSCSNSPCQNSGECSSVVAGSGTEYTHCDCPPGYIGIFCQISTGIYVTVSYMVGGWRATNMEHKINKVQMKLKVFISMSLFVNGKQKNRSTLLLAYLSPPKVNVHLQRTLPIGRHGSKEERVGVVPDKYGI